MVVVMVGSIGPYWSQSHVASSQKGATKEGIVFRCDATPTGPLSPQDHLLFMLFVGGVRSQFLDIYSNFNILQSHPTMKLAAFCHKDEHPTTQNMCFDHLGSLAWEFGQVKKEPGGVLHRVSRAHQTSDPVNHRTWQGFLSSFQRKRHL